jgi:predicted DNA repair protein MutK
MNHFVLGAVLGLAAGGIAVALMLPMAFPDKRRALTAAFVSRFSIGFLTANTLLPVHPIATGVLIGLLLSIPDALITKAYVPILVIGTILGALCGAALWFWG